MKTLVLRFVCPNKKLGEHLAYLLIPGWELLRSVNDQTLEYSYKMRENNTSFILRDEPDEAWECAIVGAFPDAEIINYPHLCATCKAKGRHLFDL